MCEGQEEYHPLQPLNQFDLRNVAGNIGLFRLPREEDAVCVPKRVSTENLKGYAKVVLFHCVAMAHTLEIITTRHNIDTFQAVKVDLPT